MRLWHKDLISKLPRQQLLGQWRECIALLGNGWGKKHKIVNYVFEYPERYLIQYSYKIANEMKRRGYNPNEDLIITALQKRLLRFEIEYELYMSNRYSFKYTEHDSTYLNECIENLSKKGIKLEF